MSKDKQPVEIETDVSKDKQPLAESDVSKDKQSLFRLDETSFSAALEK